MDKKVSIILPVYKVSAYLEECIRSLMEQDYENLEIIPVDDGSPDDCGAILDRLAAEDPRIKPIHKKNGGAASARNAGIDAATGEYLCFVDSDDMVERNYVSHLMTNLLQHDADISVCGFFMWGTKSITTQPCITPSGVYGKREYLLQFLKDWECSPLPNKLFRRECIGDIRMAEGHRIDDEFFTYKVVMNSNRVVVSDACLYHYRIRGSSVMQDMADKQERVMLDRIEYLTARHADIAAAFPELENAFFLDTLDTMTRYWNHSKDMPKAQKAIRAWVNAHRGKILKSRFSLKQKAAYLIALYIKKPQFCGESNSLELDQNDYFA